MKKLMLLGVFLFIGLNCFGQELQVTSIVSDGIIVSMLDKGGRWPQDYQVAPRWNDVLKKYNLIFLEDDPFKPNDLIQKISRMAENVTDAFPGGKAYTVYFTMGNRKFICFLYYEVANMNEYYFWACEIK